MHTKDIGKVEFVAEEPMFNVLNGVKFETVEH